MIMSADLAFADFAQTVDRRLVARERINLPRRFVEERLYDDITERLRTAVAGGSYLQLKLALSDAGIGLREIERKAS